MWRAAASDSRGGLSSIAAVGRRAVFLSVPLLLPAAAHAGSGPWVLGDGELSVYVGAETQQFKRLARRLGPGERDVVELDEGFSSIGGKVIASFGLQGRFEGEVGIPVYSVQAHRTDGETCESLGDDTCDPTRGVGVITARGKGTLLDQLYGDPVTWAVGVDLRLGHLTRATRHRLTNLGEGTVDAGGFTSLGYSGGLGDGYWSGYVELGALYRHPITTSYPGPAGPISVPGAEFTVVSETLFGLSPSVSIGPLFVGYARPAGVDFGEVDLSDPDRFAALRVFSVRTGATMIIRGGAGVTFSANALVTPWAVNTTYNTLIGFGLSSNRLVRRRE